MGHLTKVANQIVEYSDTAECKDLIQEQFHNLPENVAEDWKQFVQVSVLGIETQDQVTNTFGCRVN